MLAGKTSYYTDPDVILTDLKTNEGWFYRPRSPSGFSEFMATWVSHLITLWVSWFGLGVLCLMAFTVFYLELFALTVAIAGFVTILNHRNPMKVQKQLKEFYRRYSIFGMDKIVVGGNLASKDFVHCLSPRVCVDVELSGDYKKFCELLEWSVVEPDYKSMDVWRNKTYGDFLVSLNVPSKWRGQRKLWAHFSEVPKKGEMAITVF